MMYLRILSTTLLLSSVALAQATQPSAAVIEARANQAFAAGDYAVALPLFEKLVNQAPERSERVASLREKIQVCTLNLQSTPGEPAVMPVPIVPPTAEERAPHIPPQPGEVMELTIQQLGNFQYDDEKGGNIPEDVQKLSGATIRITGYMIPLDQAENITQFSLVPDLLACCFGAPPQIQHMVVVNCPPGKSVKYFPDEIAVEGVLKVEEKKEEDFILSIFELTASSVKPAVK